MAAAKHDLTVKILEQIRDEVRSTNVRLDETRTELGDRIERLGDRLERFERRQTETEVRLASELVAVVGAVNAVRDAIVEDRQLRRQVDDHEARLVRLERRAG